MTFVVFCGGVCCIFWLLSTFRVLVLSSFSTGTVVLLFTSPCCLDWCAFRQVSRYFVLQLSVKIVDFCCFRSSLLLFYVNSQLFPSSISLSFVVVTAVFGGSLLLYPRHLWKFGLVISACVGGPTKVSDFLNSSRDVKSIPGGNHSVLAESIRCCGPLARRRDGNALTSTPYTYETHHLPWGGGYDRLLTPYHTCIARKEQAHW